VDNTDGQHVTRALLVVDPVEDPGVERLIRTEQHFPKRRSPFYPYASPASRSRPMPVSKPDQLPPGGERWPSAAGGFRAAQWGDLVVAYTNTQPQDCSRVYRGLPGDVCPCPHYGYIFEGRLRCVYRGSDWPDEVAETGDVYFFQPGHVLVYEEPSKILEFNPAGALHLLMDHIEKLASGGALTPERPPSVPPR
jgi:hypothetical protein